MECQMEFPTEWQLEQQTENKTGIPDAMPSGMPNANPYGMPERSLKEFHNQWRMEYQTIRQIESWENPWYNAKKGPNKQKGGVLRWVSNGLPIGLSQEIANGMPN